jgi:hypothetical protein
MALYRVTYSDGFWGDEVAADVHSARRMGESLAIACGLTVVSVRKVRGA